VKTIGAAIDYRRGKIIISNRAVLESLSCECYQVTNDHASIILGYDVRKQSSIMGNVARVPADASRRFGRDVRASRLRLSKRTRGR
jgi:hypothetical protein